MRSEEERVRTMQGDWERARRAGKKMVFDPRTKTFRVVDQDDPDKSVLEVEAQDMDQFTIVAGDAS